MTFNFRKKIVSIISVLAVASLITSSSVLAANQVDSNQSNQTSEAKSAALSESSSLSSSDAEAISHLKAILGTVSSLHGNFNQKIINEKGKILQQTQGQMWLKKPGQFRWEVLGHSKRTVVSDGKQVWDFDPDLEQVTVQSLPKKKGSMPIYFLTGQVDTLDNDFIIKSYGENGKCMQNCDQCFELIPKASSSSFQWLHVGFKNNSLKELELFDQMGQRSLFSFQNLAKNASISAQHFRFTPPKGVDVVRN